MTEKSQHLSPKRPYLARAIYEWICDNQLTPYLLVDATQKLVQVPTQYIQDGQIVLNIAPHAVHQFQINQEAIFFNARFGGVSQELYIPFYAVIGIYSRENGQGLFFDPEEYAHLPNTEDALAEEKTKAADKTTENKPRQGLRVLD